jgi:hypothetical protein
VTRSSTLPKQTQAIFSTLETESCSSRPLNKDIKNIMSQEAIFPETKSLSVLSYRKMKNSQLTLLVKRFPR